jgi:ABC-2 type transport system permease protein
VLFYAAPVIVPLSTVEAKLSPTLVHIYMCNPLAVVLQQFRHAMVTHAAPSAIYALGSGALLVVPIGVVVAVFLIGFRVFNLIAPRVAEDL